MAYKQNAGRGPMMKTGAGVPSALLQTDERSGTGDPVLDRYKKMYPDSTVTVKGGKKKENPYNKTKKQKQYSVTGKDGSSFTVVPGKKVKDKSMSTKDAINKTLKDERTGS
tara:strand:+ start:372 stop:704 length:333 start_codon:yes stop_codon:yes gene_type:complete